MKRQDLMLVYRVAHGKSPHDRAHLLHFTAEASGKLLRIPNSIRAGGKKLFKDYVESNVK